MHNKLIKRYFVLNWIYMTCTAVWIILLNYWNLQYYVRYYEVLINITILSLFNMYSNKLCSLDNYVKRKILRLKYSNTNNKIKWFWNFANAHVKK